MADEIAYNTGDLDDAFSAGMFEIGDVRNAVSEFDKRYEEAEGQFPGATDRERFQEVVRGVVDELVSGFVQGTLQAAAETGVKTPDEVRQCPRHLAGFTLASQSTNRHLKQFLHH